MLTKEENDLLTLTDPGTPCGEMIRRYWQPAALSEELPTGGAPLPVRLLGEDLVLFRDPSTGSFDKAQDRSGQAGHPGLLGLHCSHRGADLSYGRLEDGGLRCIYHGWLYDIHGRCLEQPGEPAPAFRWTDSGGRDSPGSSGVGAQPDASTFRDKIRHKAYPCVERNGLILAYLGPGEPPLFPNYDVFTVPEDHVSASKLYSECNYLQGNEGNIDLIHNDFLHFVKRDRGGLDQGTVDRFGSPTVLSGRGPNPGQQRTDAKVVEGGLRISKTRLTGGDENYVRVETFVLPNLTVIPGGSINWHVPIDDTHHWKYVISFDHERPVQRDSQGRRRNRTPDYRSPANKSNRYLQDRESMKVWSYCGIDPQYFAEQDMCATEGAGPIQDRTQEHLVASDAPIVAARQLLRKAIQDVQEGRDPPGVVREPDLNQFPQIVSMFGMIPADQNWKEYSDRLASEGKGWQTLRRQ